jgi:nicotinamidase-related amidase
MERYLIVIDVQKDFVDGALGTKEAVAIIPKVKEKIAEYENIGDKIIFTRDTHTADYLTTNEGKHLPITHCIKNTDGWQIYDGIGILNAEIIDKPTFGYIDWAKHIKNSTDLKIELIGLCTDICVVSNALILKALFPEATISVDQNACAGVTPETHAAALTTMKMCQIEIN